MRKCACKLEKLQARTKELRAVMHKLRAIIPIIRGAKASADEPATAATSLATATSKRSRREPVAVP